MRFANISGAWGIQNRKIIWYFQDCKLLGVKPGKPSRRTITTINEDSVWQNIRSRYLILFLDILLRPNTRKKYANYVLISFSVSCSVRSEPSSFQVVTWGGGNWNGGTSIKISSCCSLQSLDAKLKSLTSTSLKISSCSNEPFLNAKALLSHTSDIYSLYVKRFVGGYHFSPWMFANCWALLVKTIAIQYSEFEIREIQNIQTMQEDDGDLLWFYYCGLCRGKDCFTFQCLSVSVQARHLICLQCISAYMSYGSLKDP